MKETCIGYYKKDEKFLFIYRNKKSNDEHSGKYLGIGGHLEVGESPLEAMHREFFEETGMKITDCQQLGIIKYKEINNFWQENWMHVFYINEVEGKLSTDCDEGDLKYLSVDEYFESPHWVSDEVWQKDVFDSKQIGTIEMLYNKNDLIEYKRL